MEKYSLIEQTEILAWKDLIDAASNNFKEKNGLAHKNIGGGLAINFQKMPVPLFNRVIGLGLTESVTQAIVNEIISFYSHNEKYIIHYSSPMNPANTDSLLIENGFFLAGSWERIVRSSEPLTENINNDIQIKLVDASLQESWVSFLMETYNFNFHEWPYSFSLRNNWSHYIAYENGKIVACRSFFMTKHKTLFSGVDAPVPGVMTSNYNPDFAIWQVAIRDGLNKGVELFVADIELPDPEKKGMAYEGFKTLGFEIPYTRFHYRLNK